jgi:hypothetical protein
MGEPVLRLVIPEPSGGRGQAFRWPATSQPAPAAAAPGEGATATATNGATPVAPISATEPWPAATDGATTPATNAAAGTATGPAADAAGDPAALPELRPVGRPMTAGERSARLARHWAASARAAAMRPGELPHAVWHGKPESLAELHHYAVSRAWVPDGHEGSLAPALGALYSHTVAKGGAALGLSIAWVTARALRLITFLLVAGLVVLIAVFG